MLLLSSVSPWSLWSRLSSAVLNSVYLFVWGICLCGCQRSRIRGSHLKSLLTFSGPIHSYRSMLSFFYFLFFFVLGISINKKAKMELNEFSHLLSLLSVSPPFHPLPLVTSFWRLDNLCIHEPGLKVKGVREDQEATRSTWPPDALFCGLLVNPEVRARTGCLVIYLGAVTLLRGAEVERETWTLEWRDGRMEKWLRSLWRKCD